MKDGLAARADVDSCRNAVENLFKTLGSKEKWVEGLDSVVKDGSLNKLARDIYAYLSTNGTHAKVLDQTPADAVFALLLTESLTVRILTKLGKW